MKCPECDSVLVEYWGSDPARLVCPSDGYNRTKAGVELPRVSEANPLPFKLRSV